MRPNRRAIAGDDLAVGNGYCVVSDAGRCGQRSHPLVRIWQHPSGVASVTQFSLIEVRDAER